MVMRWVESPPPAKHNCAWSCRLLPKPSIKRVRNIRTPIQAGAGFLQKYFGNILTQEQIHEMLDRMAHLGSRTTKSRSHYMIADEIETGSIVAVISILYM